MPMGSSLASGSALTGSSTSKADILLVVSLLAKGLNEASKVQKALGGISDSANKAGKGGASASSGIENFSNSLKSLGVAATAVIGTIGAVVKGIDTVLAVGAEGAKYSQMTESFATLNKVVAPNIDLLEELGDASLHTTSKFEMMNAASVALAGLTGEFGVEMANALPQLLRIAKASEKLNPALGDTGFLFQSLTVGLKRLSPRLIDNTGLQIRLSEAYEKLAKERGKAANELTAEEQQLALLNATLAAGDVLIQQAGGTVESATDKYKKFGSTLEDTKNSFKAWFDVWVGGRLVVGLDAILSFITGWNDILPGAVKGATDLALAVKDLDAAYSEYIVKQAMIAHATGEITDAQYELLTAFAEETPGTEAYNELAEKADKLIAKMGLMTDEVYKFKNATTEADIASTFDQYEASILHTAVATGKLDKRTAELIRQFNDTGVVTDDLTRKYGQQIYNQARMGDSMPIESTEQFTLALLRLIHEIGMMTLAEQKAVIAGKQLEEGAANEAVKFGLLTGEVKDLSDAEGEATKTKLTLAEAMKLAKDDTEKVRIATELFSVAIDENSAAMYEQQVQTLNNALATGEYTEEERKALEATRDETLAKLSAVDASQKLSDEEQKLAEETRKMADEARNAKTAFMDLWDGMNKDLSGLASGWLDDIKFFMSGGPKLQTQIELVGDAIRNQLIENPEDALPIFDQLYIKSQALAVANGDISAWEAKKNIVSELSLEYDKNIAMAIYEKKIVENMEDAKKKAREEGLKLTQEQIDKIEEETWYAAALGAEYDAAAKALASIGDFDFIDEFADVLSPEALMRPFASLPDDIQKLFVEGLSNLPEGGIEVSLVPSYEEDVEGILSGDDSETSMVVSLSPSGDDETQRMVQWMLEGASEEQKAEILLSLAETSDPAIKALIEEEGLDANIDIVLAEPELTDEQKKLLGKEGDLETTVAVSVTTELTPEEDKLFQEADVEQTVNILTSDNITSDQAKLLSDTGLTQSLALSVSDDISSDQHKLLSDNSLSQSISVSVSDDIASDLSILLLHETLYRTVQVTVQTSGEVPGGKAVGGRIERGQVYTVGEVRPELFVSDTAGRMMMSGRNPYTTNNTNVSSPISIAINNPSISNDFDLEILSYEIARKISERQRGMM